MPSLQSVIIEQKIPKKKEDEKTRMEIAKLFALHANAIKKN